MGYITTPLFNILRTSGEDITTPAGIYAAAMDTVFDTDGILAPISEQYRQQLVTGFALHYFRDEIGQETVPLFKMSVNEKIWNNAAEINSIFENLDKQIYKRYAVHRADRQDQSTDAVNSDEQGKSNTVGATASHDVTADTSNAARSTADRQQSNSQQNTNEAGADVRNSQNQSHGTDAQTSASNEHGNDNNLQTGGYTDIHSNATHNASAGETDSNSVAASLDTPQGSISAIRTPAGQAATSLKGYGVDAELAAPYRYLTAASSNDATSTNRDETSATDQGTSQHINDNLQSNTTSNREAQNASQGQHQQEASITEQAQNARQSHADATDAVTRSGSEQSQQSANGEATRTTSDSHQNADSRQRMENRTSASNGSDNAIDYEITNDMLNEYIPLMSRIWKIFDPCFCLLLD